MEAQIEKVADLYRIADMGAIMTPARAIDGVVKQSGRVLKPEEIVPLLRSAG